MSLNREQTAAVEEGGNLLVVALPGSGKTHLLSEKAKFILGQNPSNKLMAVTFTNEAAEELSHRISKLVGDATFKERCAVSTFHKFCANQLRRNGFAMRLISEAEQTQFVKRAASICGYDVNPKQIREVIQMIGSAKSSHSPPDFGEWFNSLYQAYTALITESKSCDFGDLILGAVIGMKEGRILPYQCTHMLVDEAQDLDAIQCEYVLMHYRNGTTVTMVGDDDQSIYRFRNSLGFRGMERFRGESAAKVITLSVNYRSHDEILQAAARCIEHNRERLHKVFNAHRGPGGLVSVVITANKESEASVLGAVIEKSIAWRGFSSDNRLKVEKEEWAVLARNNSQLLLLQTELRNRGIPYFRLSDRPIWEHQYASPLLGLINHVCKNIDGIPGNVFSWIGVPERYITVDPYSQENGISVVIAQIFDEFKKNRIEWLQLSRNRDHGACEALMSMSMWIQHWRGKLCTSDTPDKRLKIGEVLDELCDLMGSLKGSLSNRLASLKRMAGGRPSFDAVYLLSMHASKGLQFENVVVVSTNHDTMPSNKMEGDLSDEEIEEERRLFYVAVTRPKKNLLLSWYNSGPSRFIAEMGISPFPGEGRPVYFVPEEASEQEVETIADKIVQIALQTDVFAVAQAEMVGAAS